MADLPNNSNITYFAETDFRGKKTRFGIKMLDRSRHMYIIGKTGMGKSTLLENLAIQDIRNGNGMCFLDPHGSSAETLLDFVPENRTKDVVYFAPFDLEHPISFNIMEDVGADRRHLVANGLMASFKKIWPDVWSARMEYILGNTILALLEYPNSTLLGVNRMLSDKNYRNKVVANIHDPSVKSFWVDEFAKYNERYMQEAGDAIKNKIGQFTSNPLIRNIIGQPKSTFDIRQLMDDKKIIIVNLSKGRVGEQNSNLLGGMMITKIYLAAMSRANLSEHEIKKVPPFYLYVDEFQSFVNDSFADILAEARKYKLNLTIAHQYIDQMPETVRSAVFGNVGTTIAFRVGPFDAEILEKIFSPKFMQEDLVNLGFAQIYLTLMIDGVGSPPFSAKTIPRLPANEISYKDVIIESSREQFANHRAEVEKAINAWHDEQRPESDANQPSFDRPSYPPKRPQMAPERASRPAGVSMSEAIKKALAEAPNVPKATSPTPEAPARQNQPVTTVEAPKEVPKQATAPIRIPVPEAPKKEIVTPVQAPAQQPLSRGTLDSKPATTPVQTATIATPKTDNRDQLKEVIARVDKREIKSMSLSALERSNRKGGAVANKDELRQALGELMSKEKNDVVPGVKTYPPKIEHKTATKEEGKPSEKSAKKEVPEDVLRKMLEIDKNN